MTNATRYLSAAAYLSPSFATTVIRELVSSHRAVAPSVGIDLGPIIRHSLRARKAQLIRDILLGVLLLAFLILVPSEAIFVLLLAFLLGFLPSVNWGRKSLTAKIFAVIGSAILVGSFVITAIVLGLLAAFRYVEQGLGSTGQGFAGTGSTAAAASTVSGLTKLLSVAFPVAIVVTQVVYTYVRSRTLCDQLGPEATKRGPRPRGSRVESRIRRVEGAQYGNLVLYSGENPFIGTGVRSRAWSIAVELQGAADSEQQLRGRTRPQGYVNIDPVELHQAIRERLLKLNDGNLPRRERLSALTVEDHIVGLGQHRWDSPLIDPKLLAPYSKATPAAVAALIRHPQAGLRYYQRVSVCDEGQDVWTDHEKVINGSDQDIAASALVHVAVEGHMLYLEFVSTIMPPVNPRWHIVDLLPKVSPGRFFIAVVRDAFSALFSALIRAPFRALRTLTMIMHEGRSYQEETVAAQEFLYGDIGARVSVREMGAAKNFGTYIQKLDAEKYTKLTERLVTDTVMDFLNAKGVDTSAYARSANVVNSWNVNIGGGEFHGPLAFGAGATAEQHNQAQQARG
jgi:hypothetical protein